MLHECCSKEFRACEPTMDQNEALSAAVSSLQERQAISSYRSWRLMSYIHHIHGC